MPPNRIAPPHLERKRAKLSSQSIAEIDQFFQAYNKSGSDESDEGYREPTRRSSQKTSVFYRNPVSQGYQGAGRKGQHSSAGDRGNQRSSWRESYDSSGDLRGEKPDRNKPYKPSAPHSAMLSKPQASVEPQPRKFLWKRPELTYSSECNEDRSKPSVRRRFSQDDSQNHTNCPQSQGSQRGSGSYQSYGREHAPARPSYNRRKGPPPEPDSGEDGDDIEEDDDELEDEEPRRKPRNKTGDMPDADRGQSNKKISRKDLAAQMGIVPYSKKKVHRWRKRVITICHKELVWLNQSFNSYDFYTIIHPLVKSVRYQLKEKWGVEWSRSTILELLRAICQDTVRNQRAEQREEEAEQRGEVTRKRPRKISKKPEKPPVLAVAPRKEPPKSAKQAKHIRMTAPLDSPEPVDDPAPTFDLELPREIALTNRQQVPGTIRMIYVRDDGDRVFAEMQFRISSKMTWEDFIDYFNESVHEWDMHIYQLGYCEGKGKPGDYQNLDTRREWQHLIKEFDGEAVFLCLESIDLGEEEEQDDSVPVSGGNEDPTPPVGSDDNDEGETLTGFARNMQSQIYHYRESEPTESQDSPIHDNTNAPPPRVLVPMTPVRVHNGSPRNTGNRRKNPPEQITTNRSRTGQPPPEAATINRNYTDQAPTGPATNNRNERTAPHTPERNANPTEGKAPSPVVPTRRRSARIPQQTKKMEEANAQRKRNAEETEVKNAKQELRKRKISKK